MAGGSVGTSLTKPPGWVPLRDRDRSMARGATLKGLEAREAKSFEETYMTLANPSVSRAAAPLPGAAAPSRMYEECCVRLWHGVAGERGGMGRGKPRVR